MSVLVRNRQRARPVDRRLLACIARVLLRDVLHQEAFEIGVFLVGAKEMSRLNETYLRHRGSTDVITFGYRGKESFATDKRAPALHGDIFICVEEALVQARRFRTRWQEEVVRYLVHGVLHLLGYDDATARQRAQMKRQESACLRTLGEGFRILSLSGAAARPGANARA